ncbi:hypothetical protein E4P36_25605 [Streptomyces sp. 4R-3d]|nr:hypothetical protein E4P36_25605 [Streptomyces sp. 4R-3d]
MGVFERLRRKSRRTAGEARSTSSAADAPADGGPRAAEAVSRVDTGTDTVAGGDHATDGGTEASESVDIPRQQTVDEAADNEAGEGARK